MTDEIESSLSTKQVATIDLAALCENQRSEWCAEFCCVVDRLTIAFTPGSPSLMPSTQINLKAVIALKSDTARGRMMIGLRPPKPSGVYLETVLFPVLFEGEDRGINIITDLRINAEEEGHWFDVLVEDRVATRMPLRIEYSPFAIQAPQ